MNPVTDPTPSAKPSARSNVEGVDDGVDAGGEVVHAAAELVVTGEGGSLVGEAGSLVLQLFSAGGDFGGAALHFGEFDEPALVEVDEAAPFGVGGVEFAVQPGQFGGDITQAALTTFRKTTAQPLGLAHQLGIDLCP